MGVRVGTIASGWFKDPYGKHEERWISDGKPTKLVRDAGPETTDPPPDDSPLSPEVLMHADSPRTEPRPGQQKALKSGTVDALLRAIPQATHPS
jgi:hypothetical protein